MSDDDLTRVAGWVKAVAEGDEGAFRQLYDATHSRVWSVVIRILGEPPAAEEVVTDVYLQVWDRAGEFDAVRGNALAWILVRARSRAIDHLRRERLWRMAMGLESVEGSLATPDGADDPQRLLQALQRGSVLAEALATLDPQTRALIERSFFEGFTHVELQQWSGLPLGTLKSRIRRGLKRLREALEAAAEQAGGSEQDWWDMDDDSERGRSSPGGSRDVQ